MKTPAAALTWEIWNRHRYRLGIIALLIFTFALLYPKLCGVFGLDPHAPNALDAIAASASERFANMPDGVRVLHVLGLLVMLLGPLGCMVVSLLYVIWIFTHVEIDARKGFGFPSRLFTLPVTTNYLAGWLLAAGAGTLFLVYSGWTFLVHQPKIDVFEGYPNFLAWLTLLVIAQAIMWALDGFQIARLLLGCGAVSGFGLLTGPSLRDHPALAQHQTAILLAFLITGCAISFVGMAKIRQGAWQRWPWKPGLLLTRRSAAVEWRRPAAAGRTEQIASHSPREERAGGGSGRGDSSRLPLNSVLVEAVVPARKRFRSPTRAQFWFEWRAHVGNSWLFVSGLSGAALLVMSITAVCGATLSEGDATGLVMVLLGVPLLIHFMHGIAPRNVPPFLATRPLSSGDLVMARLKAAGLSAVVCWVITFAMLAVLPLLADVSPFLKSLPVSVASGQMLPMLGLMGLGLVFLTWRFVPADLWLICAQKTWAAKAAVIKLYAGFGIIWLVSYLSRNESVEHALYHMLSITFATLIVIKLFLAQYAFRSCVRRQLLNSSGVRNYMLAWVGITAALLIPSVILFHDRNWMLALALGIVLVVPLARVGFAPIALSVSRHR
jgi:hypothetical protein